MLLPFHRREYGLHRSKSWSRFTSCHLRMSPKLPLVLWTVSTVVLVKRKVLHRHYRGLPKHGFFLARQSLRVQRGCRNSLFFRLDYIGKNSQDAGKDRELGQDEMKVSLIRFAERLEEKTLDRVKGFSCGIRITTGSGTEPLEGLQGIATVSLIRIHANRFIFRWCKHDDVFKD